MTQQNFMRDAGVKVLASSLFALSLLVTGSMNVSASSHREAPLITSDPKADATDLYAFVSPDRQDTVTLIANYYPFQEPNGGPNFYPFDDNVMYEIKVDNDGDAVEDITYQFRFSTLTSNGNTFLHFTGPVSSLTDPDINVRQVYTLTKIVKGQSTVLGTNLPVPPANIGPKTTPNYASLQAEAVKNINGTQVFAGQSDDPFFVELGGIFDLVNIRKLPGNAGGGIDGLRGYSVNSLALQVPMAELTKDSRRPNGSTDSNAVIGVWTTSSRQSTKVLTEGSESSSGPWVQVSRLGAPLVNEVVIPLGLKDRFNSSKPKDDAQFANMVTDPELSKVMKALFNINVPPQGAFGSANQRDDLIAIFLTGISGLTQPVNVKPSEQLRLNLGVGVTANPNRMGVVGGDNQGYPNGRRLADDITDISLKAVAGAAYPLFHPGFTPDATGVQLGDGVDFNDVAFRSNFPYLALPGSGFDSRPHGATGIEITGGPITGAGNITAFYRLFNPRTGAHFYTTNSGERDSAVASGMRSEGTIGSLYTSNTNGTVALYRLYNLKKGYHFYTTSQAESEAATKNGFRYEGIVGYIGVGSDQGGALYRLYNPKTGAHFYTTSSSEKDSAVASGFRAEGTVGYTK